MSQPRLWNPEVLKQNPGRTILVITALSEERKAVISFLESIKIEKDSYGLSYVSGFFPSSNISEPWKVILPAPTRAGNVKSAAKTALSLSVNPDMIFLVGCAGGFPGKVNKFDVVVADRVFYVEPAKIDTDTSYIPRPDEHKVTARLLSRAQSLQDVGGWERLLNPDIPNEPVEVWIEPVAAGEKLVASSSSEEFTRIKKTAPRAVAVENEGFGVLEAAHEAAINALVIRGISDLLDDRPKEGEAILSHQDIRATQDPDKIKATRHAAAFMFGVISLLNDEDVGHIKDVEDEYVTVRMRWKDLKSLSRGRQLVIDIAEGVPISDIKITPGSVNVEFKTFKLFAALLYATWIEENIFGTIFEEKPDLIETLIDTSDPEVAAVFKSIRLLNAGDVYLQSRGRRLLLELAGRHPILSKFSYKVVDAVERRNKLSAQTLVNRDGDDIIQTRISISISEEVLDAIEQIGYESKIVGKAEATKYLLSRSLEKFELEERLSTLLYENSMRRNYVGRVNLSLDNPTAEKLRDYSAKTGLRPADIARSLLNMLAAQSVKE